MRRIVLPYSHRHFHRIKTDYKISSPSPQWVCLKYALLKIGTGIVATVIVPSEQFFDTFLRRLAAVLPKSKKLPMIS